MYLLKCYFCEREYEINDPVYKCACGGFLDIITDEKINFDFVNDKIKGLWRYEKFIPVFSNKRVTFGECFTPLVEDVIYGKNVYLKLDYLFPSGSYKDRGSAVLISKAKELGVSKIVEDSSGNAGASIAMYCAKANIEADIYVPASTSKGKLAQVRAFGANLKLVEGDRQKTSEAVLKAAENIYYASHVYNPFFFEGTKTFIFEIYEQLGYRLPDNIVMPVGNGTLLIGAYIACKQMIESGYIDKFPKFVCVQSENCAPLSQMLNARPLIYSETIAEGIAIKNPLRALQMLKIIKETNAALVTVSDNDIKNALLSVAGMGYYIEPTSASVIAALKNIDLVGDTVVELTGSGLKANDKISYLIENS